MNILSIIPIKAWLALGVALAISSYIGWLQSVHSRDQSTIRELRTDLERFRQANLNMANDIKMQNEAVENLERMGKAYSERVQAANAITASYKKRLEVALATLRNPPPEDPSEAIRWLAEQNNAMARGDK